VALMTHVSSPAYPSLTQMKSTHVLATNKL
jgi:hypothetical protein